MNMMKKNGGFTLVELIVVIAILAILAGVAVPAYTGYMDKAKEAADTQVLSAMNTAFAAACTENLVMPTGGDITGVSVTVSDKKVTGIDVTTATGVDASLASNVEADFDNYFLGNTATALQYYGSFTWSNTTGNFTGVKATPTT